MARAKLGSKGKKWVSKKISYLVKNEGKTSKQATGQAYGMWRQKVRKAKGKKKR